MQRHAKRYPVKSIGEYNVPTVKPSVPRAQATADSAISFEFFLIFNRVFSALYLLPQQSENKQSTQR